MVSRRGPGWVICSQYSGKADENIHWKRAAGAWRCGGKGTRDADHWRIMPGSPQNIIHVILKKFIGWRSV